MSLNIEDYDDIAGKKSGFYYDTSFKSIKDTWKYSGPSFHIHNVVLYRNVNFQNILCRPSDLVFNMMLFMRKNKTMKKKKVTSLTNQITK